MHNTDVENYALGEKMDRKKVFSSDLIPHNTINQDHPIKDQDI